MHGKEISIRLFLYFCAMNKQLDFKLLILVTITFLVITNTRANEPLKSAFFVNSPNNFENKIFHNDSIHNLNFRYADKKRGLKPLIIPAALIGSGVILHYSDAKYQLNEWRYKNFNYKGHVDDYLRLAPVAGLFAFNLLGVDGKNNIGNQTAIAIKSFLVSSSIVYTLKKTTKVKRPTGEDDSFPSGHTSLVFSMAHVIHKEYGEISPLFSIGAYACAATVGTMRVAKGGHWASDVLVGAGIGMLSTELVYLTHQYKWDSKHLKRLDIFPFKTGKQKGLSLVYNF